MSLVWLPWSLLVSVIAMEPMVIIVVCLSLFQMRWQAGNILFCGTACTLFNGFGSGT